MADSPDSRLRHNPDTSRFPLFAIQDATPAVYEASHPWLYLSPREADHADSRHLPGLMIEPQIDPITLIDASIDPNQGKATGIFVPYGVP